MSTCTRPVSRTTTPATTTRSLTATAFETRHRSTTRRAESCISTSVTQRAAIDNAGVIQRAFARLAVDTVDEGVERPPVALIDAGSEVARAVTPTRESR